MNVLWLCNVAPAIFSETLGKPSDVSGGWISGALNSIKNDTGISLTICFPSYSCNAIKAGEVEGVSFYTFPQTTINATKYSPQIKNYFEKILDLTNPDLIHIFGSEYPHTLSMVEICEMKGIIDKVVISIQGLVSQISKHYLNGIPTKIQKASTFRDLIRRDNLIQQQRKLVFRGIYEIESLKKVRNVIGRTDWDEACVLQINRNLRYFFCNETLRDAFYKENWNICGCEKHSIFVSQSSYPLKGFHYMVEAMKEVVKEFPNAHLYATGTSPLNTKTLRTLLSRNSYQNYIVKLIKDYNLQEKITFLGNLSENDMCKRYLRSNVFVSPSNIENSPNSVGEAMILGVPTICSDVGGVKNMLIHNIDGILYQHDAPYMLAYYIMKVFSNDELAIFLSKNASNHAKVTHNSESNLVQLKEIYEDIYKSNLQK